MRSPYGHDGSGRKGVLLVLRGPAPILLRGYYCAGGAFCPSPLRAHEALEVWIMPSDCAERGIGLAPAQGRMAERLVADRPVYALVSRHAGPELDFDSGFTGASSETSALPADPHGDLPLSWTTWRRDITAKLEGGRR